MKIKVYSKPHTMFAALYLCQQLDKLGHDATVVKSINRNDDTLHIIYNANACPAIPPNYIVYQTEVPGSTWFNGRYYDIIQGAKAVWDYSASNMQAYDRYNSNIAIVSPGAFPQTTGVKDIPYLFYGHVSAGNRRSTMLQELKKVLPLTIITNKMEADMWQILARTQVVINLHYYRNAPLEQFRVCEALSFGCHVVSERSVSGDADYSDVVQFGDIKELAGIAKTLRQKPFTSYLSRFNNLEQIRRGISIL